MATANYDLALSGEWLFHYGDFYKKSNMLGYEYHASSKAGGAVSHLDGFNNADNWRAVSVPHDWLTELPIDKNKDSTAGCKERGVAWYKKTFTLSDDNIDSAVLTFDGVLGSVTVFVNGVTAGRNFSGYNRFCLKIGDYLKPDGKNEIALRVDASRHEGWWYEGAGLYRPVNISFRKEVHILAEECFVRTKANTVIADLSISGSGKVKAVLTDNLGVQIALKELFVDKTAQISLTAEKVKLWSPEKPNLYTLTVTLDDLDEAAFNVGFRDIEWVNDEGMRLNGEPFEIKGICAHQDHSGLGAAVCEDVEIYRIKRLKSLGVNAYRCAHHAPSEALLNICDKFGMLVMVENRHFDTSNETLFQLDCLVKLSRNHPCVFLYCLFNEEPWQNGINGKRIAKNLRQRVRESDDTRYVMGAQNDGLCLADNASEALDLIGINYNLSEYEKCRKLYPDKLILGTENSPTFATRGVYESNEQLQVFEDNGTKYPADFSQPLNETMDLVKKYPFVAGCFVWSGFDHGGEPNPYSYPSVASHWGVMDSCGFDKNTANWLRAYYLNEPFMCFADFACEVQDSVTLFTNCDFAELFVDGVSYGVKNIGDNKIEWQIPTDYKKLLAVFESNGQKITATKIKWGKKSVLKATDVCPSEAKGEVKILNVSVNDQNDVPILTENGVVTIKGKVMAVGNGNPNSHNLCVADSIPLFNGFAQIIVSKNEEVELSYEGLTSIKA